MRVSAAPVPALFNKIAGDAGNGIKWMLQSSGNGMDIQTGLICRTA